MHPALVGIAVAKCDVKRVVVRKPGEQPRRTVDVEIAGGVLTSRVMYDVCTHVDLIVEVECRNNRKYLTNHTLIVMLIILLTVALLFNRRWVEMRTIGDNRQ